MVNVHQAGRLKEETLRERASGESLTSSVKAKSMFI